MHKPNLEKIEQEIRQKYEKKDKKAKKKMKVDGGSVKKISKIIINKSKN